MQSKMKLLFVFARIAIYIREVLSRKRYMPHNAALEIKARINRILFVRKKNRRQSELIRYDHKQSLHAAMGVLMRNGNARIE